MGGCGWQSSLRPVIHLQIIAALPLRRALNLTLCITKYYLTWHYLLLSITFTDPLTLCITLSITLSRALNLTYFYISQAHGLKSKGWDYSKSTWRPLWCPVSNHKVCPVELQKQSWSLLKSCCLNSYLHWLATCTCLFKLWRTICTVCRYKVVGNKREPRNLVLALFLGKIKKILKIRENTKTPENLEKY